jgi:hypothetical protein
VVKKNLILIPRTGDYKNRCSGDCFLFDLNEILCSIKSFVMKYFFTFCFSLLLIKASSQTPLAESFHGCGGATVVAYPSDPTWTSITYMFQRFEGGSWGTVHTNTNNWHLVATGDITVPTNYRVVLRNNVTLEERTSNGVTVNPAHFSNTVLPPVPEVTMFWGTDSTGGINYVEFLPYQFGAITRPPFTFSYKKTTDINWQTRVHTTGIFIFPVDANAQYQFQVSDVCGQSSPVITKELYSIAQAVQSTTNCNGGVMQVGVEISGRNFTHRFPFTYGIALLPPGTPTNPVPDAILNSLVYNYNAGNISGLAPGQYVVRGKDRFSVLTKYTVVTITVAPPAPPFVISYGGNSIYCQYFATLQSNPHLKGIRLAGTGQPYVFSTGLTFSNLQGGQTYETVLKDTCGTISAVTLLPLLPVAPRINSTPVTVSNCKYVITINSDVCSTPQYAIQPNGSPQSAWQSSNVFSNLPMAEACYTIFVRDINSGLITQQQVCTDGMIVNVNAQRDFQDCNSSYYVQISPVNGVPPYTYSISYDGIHFPAFSPALILYGQQMPAG